MIGSLGFGIMCCRLGKSLIGICVLESYTVFYLFLLKINMRNWKF